MAPSQWALPPGVLAARERRGELLYRSARSARPEGRVPVVIVLDVSPATWGPAGDALRTAAAAVCEGWSGSGCGVWVVAAGGEDRVWEVRSAGDTVPVWTARSSAPADGARAVRVADRVRRGLGWSGGAVLALSHPWFAGGTARPGRVAAVFVRPAGCRGSAPWGWADRHAEVNANDPAAAVAAAVQLLTTPW